MDNLPQSGAAASEREQNPTAAQQLKSQVETAKQETANLKRAASEQTAAAFESAKSNLKEAAQEAKHRSEGAINEQKTRLAEIVHEYCQAARAASERLRQEGHTALADRADDLAFRFLRASTYLREKKLSEIYNDAEQFTRRRPEIVFGLMFAAGLVAARFLKASDHGAAISNRTPNVQGQGNLPEASSTASAS
jgi:hypothetical protein